jgi:hypothetical protein
MQLTGTLQQLDSTTGIAPQNNGLFASRTVAEMLFGYTNALGVAIPAITLGYVRPTTDAGMAELLVQDGQQYRGRTSARVMGIQDVSRVGQWVTYNGVASYVTNCDLTDPSRVDGCASAAGRAALDWTIYAAPGETIHGSSDALHAPPLKEGDGNILPELVFYVPELQRRVPATYAGPTSTQDIALRRYRFNPAMSVASAQTPNPWKNDAQWKQGGVPDGLISQQDLNGGVPAFASQPYFGRASASVFESMTCMRSGMPVSCGAYEVDLHDTFLDVEPLTGLTMRGANRLQANVRISASEYRTSSTSYGWNYHYNNLFGSDMTRTNQTLYVPYYWVDQQDEISASDAQTFRDTYNTAVHARHLAWQLRIAGLVCGVLGMVVSLLLLAHVTYDVWCARSPSRVATSVYPTTIMVQQP